ncbi:hypothetical protein GmHk_17G048305 [Glycine max]|nr:hypothetical protein GYH30_046749 [Glycine max]KAH1201666.1 hypothetical protein GmHk_17G048305 [Glycine max]
MASIDSDDSHTVLLSVTGLKSESGVKLLAEAGGKVDYRAQSCSVARWGMMGDSRRWGAVEDSG